MADSRTLVSFALPAFTQAVQGEIRSIDRLTDFAESSGIPTEYAAYAADGSLLFIGPAAELGFTDSSLPEGSRVIIERFTYRVPT